MPIPKRILLLTLRSDQGGGPKLVAALATALKDQVDLYIANPLDPPYGRQLEALAKIHFPLRHRKWSFVTLIRLRKFCRINKIDLVHAHGFGAGLYARFLGRPVIYQPHGIHAPVSRAAKIKIILERVLQRLTDTTIYISDSEKLQAEALRISARCPVIVPNPLLGEPILRKRETKDIVVFGNLGRLDPIKQQLLLIDLFNRWNQSNVGRSRSCLKIMGDGECREKIEAAIDANSADVELLPFAGEPFVFLSTLDLFVSASRSEGFGLAVLEAMACGVPCLISNVPGHREFINKGWAVGFDAVTGIGFDAGASMILDGRFDKPSPDAVRSEYCVQRWVSQITNTYRETLERVRK